MDLMQRRRLLLGMPGIPAITWDANHDEQYLNDSGSYGPNANTHVSNLLPLSAGKYVLTFTLNDFTVKTFRVHEYDSSGVWERMSAKYVVNSTGQHSVPFDTQGKYIRISCPKAVSNYSISKPKSAGNLLNVDDTLKLMYSSYTNFTGANGTATITGNALGGWIMHCEPNTTYTYSHKCYTSGGEVYSGNRMEYRAWTYDHYPASYGDSSRTQLFSVARSDVQTFATGANAQYLLVGFFCNWQDSMSPYLTLEQMQIELGGTATPYEPY